MSSVRYATFADLIFAYNPRLSLTKRALSWALLGRYALDALTEAVATTADELTEKLSKQLAIHILANQSFTVLAAALAGIANSDTKHGRAFRFN